MSTTETSERLRKKAAQSDVRAILEEQGVYLSTPTIDAIVAAALASQPVTQSVEPVAWRKRHFMGEGKPPGYSYTNSLDNVPEWDRNNLEPLFAAPQPSVSQERQEVKS